MLPISISILIISSLISVFLFRSTPTDWNDKKFINIYFKERWGPWSNWIFRLTGHIDLLNIRQSMAQLKSLFNSKKVVPTSMYQACFASFKEDVTSTRTALKKKDRNIPEIQLAVSKRR